MSLILASTSFRRQQLMRWLALDFEIMQPDFEEDSLSRADFPSTRSFVETLSLGKALSLVSQHPHDIIIAGDTLVDLAGRAIGKPKNLDDARETLLGLSGKTHQVYSGITCIVNDKQLQRVVSDRTDVTFKKLNDQVIEKYVQSGVPLGKAGSYALQEGASEFVEKIEGSVTNVLGLPLLVVAQLLLDVGIHIDQQQLRKRIEAYLPFDFPHDL